MGALAYVFSAWILQVQSNSVSFVVLSRDIQLTFNSCNEVWDLGGESVNRGLLNFRELYMKTGQGFLLVFSITSQSSLSELSELREQIIRIKDDENVPIVIVGNKSDLESERVVTRARAFSVSQSWGNAPYYETSARRRGTVILF